MKKIIFGEFEIIVIERYPYIYSDAKRENLEAGQEPYRKAFVYTDIYNKYKEKLIHI